jgi:ATP-binding cassette subfamily C protein LapB
MSEASSQAIEGELLSASSAPAAEAPAASRWQQWRAQGQQHWQTARQQSEALLRWLWAFFNAPGPHENQPEMAVDRSNPNAAPADWLHTLLLPLRPAYKQALMLAFLVNLIGLGAAVFTLQVYDRVVAHAGYSSLVALVIGMLIATGLDHGLRNGRAMLLQRVGARIEAEIARRAAERMQALPTLILETRPPAYWQMIFRDVELVRTTCAGATALMLIDLPFLILSLLLLALIALPVLPVAILTIAAFVILAWRSGQVTRNAAESEREKLVNRDVMIGELASARLMLKSVGASVMARQRWEASYAAWMDESLQRGREADHYRDVAHAMMTLNTVITTGFGALAILSNLMSMGALIAANILAGRMVAPLVQLVGHWRSFGQFQAAKKRLDALFEAPLDRAETAVALARPQGVLKLENAGFRYPKCEHEQLQSLTVQIGPFGLHGIVGANGSGKTTLLKLLRGLYPAMSGRVLLEGGDIAQFGQSDLARWIGYLPQQVQLVSGSIRDNIALADPAATDEMIIRAAKLANAHDFVMNLPDGYATEVGEGGGRFSGGERKRIAIAQVLLRDPPILLLDEPTADLDSLAEQAFMQNLRSLAADHTVIMVTHSPPVLIQCNGILVLEKGKLVAGGPAAQVLPKLGLNVNAVAKEGGEHVTNT